MTTTMATIMVIVDDYDDDDDINYERLPTPLPMHKSSKNKGS